MPRDIKELLHEGANPPIKGPNMDAVMRRSRTITWQRRAAAAAGVVALCAAAFIVGTRFAPDELSNANNVQPSTSPTPQPGVVASPQPDDEPSPVAGEIEAEVWFHQGELLAAVYMPTTATFPSTPAPGDAEYQSDEASRAITEAALTHLFEGTASEFEPEGFGTSVPDGTTLIGVTLEGGVATVNVSSEFESGGGSLSMQMRLAQLVYTATQAASVDAMVLEIEGEPVSTLGGEGITIDGPLTRSDSPDQAPAITVDSPERYDLVTSPVTIAGTANVFEATVSMRIVDAEGNLLSEGFDTATCGSGCRGDYDKKMTFETAQQQLGYVEVFEASAEDGSAIHVIRVPVFLSP